jgi:hypothetical protein
MRRRIMAVALQFFAPLHLCVKFCVYQSLTEKYKNFVFLRVSSWIKNSHRFSQTRKTPHVNADDRRIQAHAY